MNRFSSDLGVLPDLRGPLPFPQPTERVYQASRAELRQQGIVEAVLDQAEAQGTLGYLTAGPVMMGYDADFTLRAMVSAGLPLRVVRGSEASFLPILRGEPRALWLVERGHDALAVWTMYTRQDRPLPTVLVRGAARTAELAAQPTVRELLGQAERLRVGCDGARSSAAARRLSVRYQRLRHVLRAHIQPSCELSFWQAKAGRINLADQLGEQRKPT